ncbi:MAG: polysaccharide biosynthesis/export family protein [Chthoniobacteraceae bacterium]
MLTRFLPTVTAAISLMTGAALSQSALSSNTDQGANPPSNVRQALAAASRGDRLLAAVPTRRAIAVDRGDAGSARSGAPGTIFRLGDIFEMRLGGVPMEEAQSFAAAYTIGGDGTVNIPLIGQVRALGLTQSQLEREIEKRFIDEKFFRWPTVTINVPISTRYVTVGGDVRSPNRIGWSADMTLLGAITTCGGPNEYAGDRINLIRDGKVIPYSRKKLQRDPALDPKVAPGDRIEIR